MRNSTFGGFVGLLTITLIGICAPTFALAQKVAKEVLTDRALVYRGDFRILNWNANSSDENFNLGRDEAVGAFVLEKVSLFDPNVITLQEISSETFLYLSEHLGGAWDCHTRKFGLDYIATCVKGVAVNFYAQYLTNIESTSRPRFWGYVQVEYNGVLITNVHVRGAWKNQHVAELHHIVRTGIIAGDFNHPTPELCVSTGSMSPCVEWRQINPGPDVVTLWTKGRKVDHILTVELPDNLWSDVHGFGHINPYACVRPPDDCGEDDQLACSNHCMLLAVMKLIPSARQGPEKLEKPFRVDGPNRRK